MKIAGNEEDVARLVQEIKDCIMQLSENIKLMNGALAVLDNDWIDMEYQQMRDVVYNVMKSVGSHLDDIVDLCNGLHRYGALLERGNCENKCNDSSVIFKKEADPNCFSVTQETWHKLDNAIVYDRPVEKRKDLELSQGKVHRFHGTCGLCSCVNILRLAGVAITEKEMVAFAREHKLCQNHFWLKSEKNGATSADDRQQILKYFGISSVLMPPDIEAIADAVENGKGVIISVYASQLWNVRKSSEDLHAVAVTSVKKDCEGNILGFYIADSGIHGMDGDGYYSKDKLQSALTKRFMNVTTQVIR